jgi:hypothetical protein
MLHRSFATSLPSVATAIFPRLSSPVPWSRSAGIFCFLKDENLVRLDWQVSNFIGGIRLQVAATDVEAAEAILSQPVPDVIDIPDQPGFQQPRCPRCTSTDIIWERQGRKAALASLYLFSLPLPRGSESWTCNSCGLRWVDDEDQTQTTP